MSLHRPDTAPTLPLVLDFLEQQRLAPYHSAAYSLDPSKQKNSQKENKGQGTEDRGASNKPVNKRRSGVIGIT